MRVACYVDGFNLYHAIDSLGDDRLKWVDLGSLAASYVRPDQELVRTAFFTARSTWDAAKRERHTRFINALKLVGVDVVEARFQRRDRHCQRHDRYCPFYEEKESDVAIAVEVLMDIQKRGVERILLVTADSDQIPLVKAVRTLGKIVYLIAPPGRLSAARDLGQHCNGVTELSPTRIGRHALPKELRDPQGRLLVARPAKYQGDPSG